jgi:hypothetical protein
VKEAKLLLPEDNDWCLQKAAEGANSGIEISIPCKLADSSWPGLSSVGEHPPDGLENHWMELKW